MRKAIVGMLVFIILFFNGLTTVAEGNLQPPQEWLYQKDIQQVQGSSNYAFVFLDMEVYGHAAANLSDVRVMNSQNQFVPYYLVKGSSNSEVVSQDYQSTFVQSFINESNTYHDFKIVSPTKQDVLLNKIALRINSQSYLFNTEVYGSHDNLNWSIVGSYKVYKVDNNERNTIDFAQSLKYPYYRIVLLNNGDKSILLGLTAQYSEKVERYQQFARTIPLQFSSNSENRTTKILIKNPYLLNIETIKLKTSGNFYRYYKLQGLVDNVWRDVSSGTLYATNINNDVAEDTRVELSSLQSCQEYNLVISDQDDKPINISEVEAVYFVDKLVFAVEPGESYRLVYDNVKAERPIYDIENYKAKIEKTNIAEAALGPENAREVNKAADSPNYGPKIFNALIIITSICLVIIIGRKIKFKG
ncbi:MAG: DUF3999 family protein [Syntrophomonadaceae bacterium]|nr:DUF3999 family protein [Syntrophomonadaceae bacterium]